MEEPQFSDSKRLLSSSSLRRNESDSLLRSGSAR